MQWYFASGSKQVGPISVDEFQLLVSKGTIDTNTLVWNSSMTDWTKYGDIEKRPFREDPPSFHFSDPNATTCSQCGKLFSPDDMIQYKNNWVCASCKPVFIQKLKEGIDVSGAFHFAGFWIRFLATFLDGLILTCIQMVFILPMNMLIISRFGNMANANAPDFSQMGSVFILQALLSALQLAIAIVYETWFIGKIGATPGKMACKLKVINADGSPVSYLRALGRHLSKFISWIVMGIGFIMVGFDKEKRGLHDHICETRVIKKEISHSL